MPRSFALTNGAAAAGALTRLAWLYSEQHCDVGEGIHLAAAIGGSIDVLRWLAERGVALTDDACYFAAQHNRLDTLQYLHSESRLWTADAAAAAALYGSLAVLRWSREAGLD
jgi:hypothetical protein